MSLSNSKYARRGFLLGALALSACGFEPVLGGANGERFRALRGRVALPSASNRESFALRNQLESYFGVPEEPVYSLELTYSTTVKSLTVSQNGQVSRQRIIAEGRYRGRALRDSRIILDQPYYQWVEVNKKSDRFANDQANLSARDRLARAVADDFTLRFMAALDAEPAAL